MKKRWYIYIVIGILFGIFDFYYQEFTQDIHISSFVIWFVVAWVVWLIPSIPIVLYETKVSESKKKSVLANILVWSISVCSYYLYMAIKLIFIGQESMKFLHISNYKDQFYLSNLKNLFLGDVLSGITEWIVIAIVGGTVCGFLISFIYLHIRRINEISSISN
ncbi:MULTISPECIES: hypothetical protein [unclassified Clostridium]|uniref:hypothetical protein n=2 Tax=unclassified Clostridium TaxID=2614128 RepID=UPI00030F147D|nr:MULTISPECIES: hypothetical protein [unclassified Clostridium]MBN1047051.1 hypothetical protein [Clostridium botulinum]MBN1056876.1 hypothetical protein [Clostridium botulinum]